MVLEEIVRVWVGVYRKAMKLFVSHARQGGRPILWYLTAANCLLIAACGQAGSAPEAPVAAPVASEATAAIADVPDGGVRVVFLGDSLTAGYGLAQDDALPEQVEAIWRANGINAEAINAGVSGDTTANGLARFDWSVSAADPDLLVISLGANDFLLGIDADITRANLKSILDLAQTEGIPAVLVGLEPRGEIQAGSREAEFAAVYPELAAEYGVAYYPSLLAPIESDPAMLQPDGLHPTSEGVGKISESLAGFLAPIVSSLDE